MRTLVRISLLLALSFLLLIINTFSLSEVSRILKQGTAQFGYVFYATTDLYACSALVNVHRLRFLFHTKHPVYLLASSGVSDVYKERFRERYNVTVIEHEPPPLAGDSSPYYRDVLLKLISFNILNWAPQLRRILVIDSDQIILKPLDGVFAQYPPDVEIAGAHAYWLPDDPIATSAMIMVSLSTELWRRMNSSLTNITTSMYDMDLINSMFRGEMMLLPGNYVTLNSHWETNELPVWAKYRAVLPGQPAQNNTMNSTDQEKQRPSPNNARREEARNQTVAPSTTSTPNTLSAPISAGTFTTYDPAVIDPLTSIFNEEVYILHFTALGKPWSYTVQSVRKRRPKAHPLFAQQFLLWRMAARQVCPVLDIHGIEVHQLGGKRWWVTEDGELPSDWFLDEV
jgi:hypothetical protein